jgi:hypothetical protein
MDIIDLYFKKAGPKIDNGIIKYFGLEGRREELEYRLADSLGIEGIDNIMKIFTSKVIEYSCGEYQLRFKIVNWDVSKDEMNSKIYYSVSNIDTKIDPKSTLYYDDTTYKIADLFNYSNIDELNFNYNTEDNPITEDDIEQIGYKIQDCILDWLDDNVYPLTGVNFEDVYPSNARPFDLYENIDRIKNLMKINEDDMVFVDEIKPKHKRAIEDVKNTIFSNYNYSKFKELEYPDNESEELVDELKTLADIDVDEKFVEEKDDIVKSFKKLLKQHDIKLNEKKVGKFLDETGTVILDLKYHFNRPRPFQLNKVHNVKVKNKMMDSMKSPSFPSGHATQARVMGRILSSMLPKLEDEIMNLADDVSFSRNMAKAHFPSDTKAGKKLGDDMYEYLTKEKKIGDLDFLS